MFLFEANLKTTSKNAVVMVGRFNPPTIGHYKVIDAMKAYMRKNPHDVHTAFIVVIDGEESGKDKEKNPLTAKERVAFLKATDKTAGMNILVAPDAFEAYRKVQEAGYVPLVVAAGSDRAKRYVETLDEYFKEGGKKIKHYHLDGLDRTEDGTGNSVKSVSATLARNAAEHNYYEEFVELTGLENKPKLAKLMFDKVRTAIINAQKEKESGEDT